MSDSNTVRTSLDVQKRVHEYGMILIAFLFPLFQKALPIMGLLLGSNALLFLVRHPSPVRSFFREKEGKALLYSMGAFYLLHCVGTLYSEDIGSAMFDLQKKVGLLFFPLLIASMPSLSARKLSYLLIAFVAGALVVSGIGSVQALNSYWSHDKAWVGYLYGKYFAFGMHRSYLAVYLLFGSYVLAQFLRYIDAGVRSLKWWGLALLLLFLLGAVFMTASRAALLALPFLILLFVLGLSGVRLWKRWGIYAVTLLTVLGALFLFPRSQERIRTSFEKVGGSLGSANSQGAEELADTRFLTWSVAAELLAEYPLTGVGTGDDRNALVEAYRKKGYEDLAEDRLDAHSQYLQTGVALGLPGICLLLWVLVQGAMIGWKRSGALCQLVLILFLTALFESVLERQAGILFFAFFMPLFAIRGYDERESSIWKGGG